MSRDIEASKALLAEAGYPDGIELEIACKPDPAWELLAVQGMVEQWKDAGIDVTINVMPSAQFWEVWDKVPFGFTAWTHRPLGFMVLSLAYSSGVPWNESHYANAEFDAKLTEAAGILDVEARSKVMGELETIMQDDGPLVQPIWRAVYVAYDSRGAGFCHAPDQLHLRQRTGPRTVLADIPQMTSKFAEIVPRPHLQGDSVPIAAIR